MDLRKTAILGVWGLLFVSGIKAQSGGVRFRVADRATREAVIGAVAELRSRTDSLAAPLYTASGTNGKGEFQRVPAGSYRLTLTSLGYDSLRRDLKVGENLVTLDSLWLTPRAEAIDDVVIETPALRSSVHGDTLSYHAAAYKVAFGTDAGTLLSKMPGLEVDDSGIAAQGRSIQRVYVDGREFFGNDVMSAVRNIPSDMIESIEIYNSQGDQAEFTGVDTGEGFTALNIVTRPDKRRGTFGRIYGAYGVPDKYIGGGNANIFDNDRRVTIIGLANNVSRQNFSFEDILGTTEEKNGAAANKNFMVKPLAGISTVQAVGVNYSDDWGAKAKITASYFFNRTDNLRTPAASLVVGLPVALDALGAADAVVKAPYLLLGMTPEQLAAGQVPMAIDCWLDFFDVISEGIFMPLGALIMAVLIGWKWKTRNLIVPECEISGHKFWGYTFFDICFKFITPIGMILVLGGQIYDFFIKALIA